MTSQPTVEVSMLIRVSPEEAYGAFADPAVTTRFWFTDSTGPLVAGTTVEWTWRTVGVTVPVEVLDTERARRLRVRWSNGGDTTVVEWRFDPHPQGTWVHVTESDFHGTEQEITAHVVDSTGGFLLAVAAAKVLLEHGIDSRLVADSMPVTDEH